MSYEITIFIALASGLIGMGLIIYQKIPVLVRLPEVPSLKKKDGFALLVIRKVKKLSFFKNLSYDIFLQKMLSRIRILTLKTDNKTFNWLQKLREKTQKKKLNNDNYWEEIKNSTHEK